MSYSIDKTRSCVTKFLEDLKSDPQFREKYLTVPTAFTRNRKLPLSVMAQLLLLSMKSTYSAEIPIELSHIVDDGTGDLVETTKSAYSQRRKLIKPEMISDWARSIAQEALGQGMPLKRWHGMIPVAMDGTTVSLPPTRDNAEAFGKCKNGQGEQGPMAKVLILASLLDPLILDFDFGKADRSEHVSARALLHNLTTEHLLILDRGFPSFSLIHYLNLHKINFIIRLPRSFSKAVNEFANSDSADALLEIKANTRSMPVLKRLGIEANVGDTIKIRVVRFITPNGKEEILATNLPLSGFSIKDIGDAYLLRWKVEVDYFFLKEEQQAVVFSGYRPSSILQDLAATIAMFNICGLYKCLSCKELDIINEHRQKGGKHLLAVDNNVAYCFVRCFITIIIGDSKRWLGYSKEIIRIMVHTAIEKNISPGRDRVKRGKRNLGRHWTDLNFKDTMLI